MSSTNVHSEKENRKNFEFVSGETLSDERGTIDIPPVATVRGSDILAEIKNGNFMTIPAGKSKLHRDGKCVDENGKQIANYSAKEIKEMFRNAEQREAKLKSQDSKQSDMDSSR